MHYKTLQVECRGTMKAIEYEDCEGDDQSGGSDISISCIGGRMGDIICSCSATEARCENEGRD